MDRGTVLLGKIEELTGKTPKEFVTLAKKKGYGNAATKPGTITSWLKEDFGLGHGYATALMHFIRKSEGVA